MKEHILISIIIPSFNRKYLLKRTIESVKNQTYPADRYEIIVVDDGSKDDIEDLVRTLQEKGYRTLKYLHQKHKGPAAARNLGINHAGGNIIAFIDSDSIATKTWLEEITKGYDSDIIAGIGGLTKVSNSSITLKDTGWSLAI